MKKKAKTPEFKILNKSDFHYYVNLNWDASLDDDCDHNYCACSTIENIFIKEVYYEEMFLAILGNRKRDVDSIKTYCLDRALKILINKNSFETFAISGYYGEEPRAKISDLALSQLNEIISLLNNKSDTKCIERLLILEYSHVLDDLKNKKWHIDTVQIDRIKPGAPVKVDRDMVEFYKEEKTLSCLCIKEGNYFRLIDGYHRYNAAIKNNNKEIKVVYCHPE